MKIMESRVKSIIREEVGRAIRSRLLREADPDYPYPPDARSNRERDAYFARGEDPAEAAAERAMAGEDDEGDDDTDADRNRDDEALDAGLDYGPRGYDFAVVDAFNSMDPKPVGLIVDCSNMESGPGGFYPLYQATEAGTIKKISGDIGVAAFAFSDMISESATGEMPEGCWVAGMIDDRDDGNLTFKIYNTI
jgi:hypothetical protein